MAKAKKEENQQDWVIYDDYYEMVRKRAEEVRRLEEEEGKKMKYLNKRPLDSDEDEDLELWIDDIDEDFDDWRVITFEDDDYIETDFEDER